MSPQTTLAFLDDVIRDILDSWTEDNFLDRESAARELEAIARWLRSGVRDGDEPGFLSDRLLTRRLAEVLLHGVVNHWRKHGEPDRAQEYMEALASLQRLPWMLLPEHGDAFRNRLADPDGFELVLQLGHDLRSPLTSITFLAETLLNGQSGPLTEQQKAQLGLIYSASVGLSSIVADVVDLGRAGGDPLDGDMEAFSIHSIVESVRQVVQPQADAKKVEFRTKITAHDRVRGHPLALNRVLLNLAINGLKFTEHGWVELSVSPAGVDLVEFGVRDTGPGIPEESRDKLFQPFRKAPERKGSFFSSSGLGLAIVRRLLLSMGSELELETEPDWGTRFHFTLELPIVKTF